MSTATSATTLLNSMDQAEKDLALYAAIIGCRPTFEGARTEAPRADESAPAESASVDESPASDGDTQHADALHPGAHHPHRLSIWMQHVSHEARRRIHEAKMRLAS